METDCRIIVVDDDPDYLMLMDRKLSDMGYHNVALLSDPVKAALLVESGGTHDIALIDMTMPAMDGMVLLDRIRKSAPETECIMITAVNEAATAVECLKKGALDYLVKPVTAPVLARAVERALEHRRVQNMLKLEKNKKSPCIANVEAFSAIVTQSDAVIRVLREAELHAASDVPILITGESGTGKELLARAIHTVSHRAKHPFTAINMPSMSGSLFEAEFFGHTRGAFTGAETQRVGHLEHTHLGTLFLDEIGDLPIELQGKLLRVLQNGEFTRLGSSQPQKVDLRFIAATNENLDRMVVKKTFRKDLYYRIRGGWLHLPPLRERVGDIPLLANKFLQKYYDETVAPIITDAALEILQNLSYPGNIRELKSLLQSAANLARGSAVGPEHLPDAMKRRAKPPPAGPDSRREECLPTLSEVEKHHILHIYKLMDSNKSLTARTLGIGLNTLRRKLGTYGIR